MSDAAREALAEAEVLQARADELRRQARDAQQAVHDAS